MIAHSWLNSKFWQRQTELLPSGTGHAVEVVDIGGEDRWSCEVQCTNSLLAY